MNGAAFPDDVASEPPLAAAEPGCPLFADLPDLPEYEPPPQQQQQHQQQQPAQPPPPPPEKITSIHGIGLWDSWTRNFATPMLAMWDLLDNAIDAGCPTYGQVHIDPDRFARVPLSGIRIMNTCREPVTSLRHVLKAYKSSKAKAVEADPANTLVNDGANGQSLIGENGVGYVRKI